MGAIFVFGCGVFVGFLVGIVFTSLMVISRDDKEVM